MRRLPPRRALAPDRRARRLLRRLRPAGRRWRKAFGAALRATPGSYSPFRRRRHGAPAADVPARPVRGLRRRTTTRSATAPGGERLTALVDGRRAARLAAALLLLSPYVPLLFMGEEYGETDAVPVLREPRRPGAGRSGARGAAPRVRRRSAGSGRSPTRRPKRRSRPRGRGWALARAEPHAGSGRCTGICSPLRRAEPALAARRPDGRRGARATWRPAG